LFRNLGYPNNVDETQTWRLHFADIADKTGHLTQAGTNIGPVEHSAGGNIGK